jgi:transposase
MTYIKGFNRNQAVLIPESIDLLIDKRINEIRFIDSFVDSLTIVAFGFKDIQLNKNGRPPYHPKDLLKIIFTVTSIKFVLLEP